VFGLSRAGLIAVPLLLGACHTWRTVPMSPNESGPLPRESTVVLVGGERVSVEGGRTTRDSLISQRVGGARFAVPRDCVSFVEERKVSAVRSVAVGLGGVALVVSVVTVALAVAFLSAWN
jgi:hypothetical protein